MPRTKRPQPYANLNVQIPVELRDRLEVAITPPGHTKPPFARRQQLLIRLIRNFCDEQESVERSLDDPAITGRTL